MLLTVHLAHAKSRPRNYVFSWLVSSLMMEADLLMRKYMEVWMKTSLLHSVERNRTSNSELRLVSFQLFLPVSPRSGLLQPHLREAHSKNAIK
jgi:hypothetical protein